MAFVPSIFTSSNATSFTSRKTVCSYREARRCAIWISSLEEASGNGADSSPDRSVQSLPPDAKIAMNGLPPDEDAERELFRDPSEILNDARIVPVKLPLDAYLEESVSGQAFVDELVPDGNAEKSGQISEGDIIVAVSLPFGDGLFPVPQRNALGMVQEHVQTRGESEEYFYLALVSSPGAEFLRQQLNDKADREQELLAKMQENVDKIYINEYPSIQEGSSGVEEFGFDPDFLRAEGFEMGTADD